jgi:protein SCO1/2
MKTKNIIFSVAASFIFLLTIALVSDVNAENPEEEPAIGIVEKLGSTIPDDVMLKDENGNDVSLKSLIDKPTVVSLVYFRCPGICTPLLNGLTTVVRKTDLIPGKDFKVLTISFDHTEDFSLAASKKENYLTNLNREIPKDSWRFLTGDSANIAKVSNTLGFKFQKQGSDFVHGASIMVLSSEGKLVRYLYGTDYLPFDFKMAITEAGEGRISPTIAKVVKMCFSYDAGAKKYVLNVTRIAGGGILLLLGIFVGVLIFKKKKVNNKTELT